MGKSIEIAGRGEKSYNVINGGLGAHLIQALPVSKLWGPPQLFVQTWEQTPEGRQDIYDIFDSEGRFFGRVALGLQVDLINPKNWILRGNKLYTIEPAADGFEVVKRYSIEWKVKSG